MPQSESLICCWDLRRTSSLTGLKPRSVWRWRRKCCRLILINNMWKHRSGTPLVKSVSSRFPLYISRTQWERCWSTISRAGRVSKTSPSGCSRYAHRLIPALFRYWSGIRAIWGIGGRSNKRRHSLSANRTVIILKTNIIIEIAYIETSALTA